MNKGLMVGSLLSGTRNHKFTNYIKSARKMRVVGTGAVAAFLILSGMFVAPLYFRDVTRATVGTAKAADTTLTVKSASNKSSVAIDVTSSDGTFAASTADNSAQFSVVTNNFTGYTLTITPGSTTQSNTLSTGSATFETLPNTVSAATFSTSSSLNGKWGYTFYKSGSSATNYYPGGAANNKIEETSVANSTENIYYIGLGVRAGYGQAAGTYNNSTSSNTYVVAATGNNISYKISFADNTSDSSVSGLPSALSSATSTTSVTLPTTTPTRTGYTFAGWCLGTVSGGTTCTGTKYAAADVAAGKAAFGIDQTEDNSNITLYSYWTINQYTCTKQYRLQNADGSYGSYVSSGTEQVNYGATCSYTKSLTSSDTSDYAYYNSGNSKTTSGTMGASGLTLSLDFPRNTYTLTVSRNTSYISSAIIGTSGSTTTGTYRWGQTGITIKATASSGNEFTNWTVQSGTTAGTFASSTSAQTTYTMPKGNSTVYANGKSSKLYMQSMAASDCTTTAKTVYDNRDETAYVVQQLSDGKCWMLENLALNTTKQLTSADTNLSTSWSLPSSGSWTNSYTAKYIAASGTCSTSNSCTYNGSWTPTTLIRSAHSASTTYKVGVYYNYCAASAGTICSSSNSSNASYDICPKGWRMPTGGSNGEYQTLYTKYSSNFTNYSAALRLPLSGYYSSGNTYNQGNVGYWWSSTYYNSTNMHSLSANTSSVYPTDGNVRQYGYSMRCVLK